ncbi:MAG: hypothetical protein QNJ97_06010 [Myxococcota bacterium]|nr:hypothetical protein [Myxococcota bacterium]
MRTIIHEDAIVCKNIVTRRRKERFRMRAVIHFPKPSKGRLFSAFVMIACTIIPFGNVAAEQLKSPASRQGYYFSLGGGGAITAGFNGDEDEWLSPFAGPIGTLRTGQSILDWLDLGIGLGTGGIFNRDYSAIIGHLAVEAQFRPLDPLFIRASTGFGFADVSRRKKNAKKITGQFGGAYGLAVGYDFFPFYRQGSGGFGITPTISAMVGAGDMFTTVTMTIGIEISWWTGLPKDQLDLPIDQAYENK